jgi:hypothetical protein
VNEYWICQHCKSLNRAGTGKCYRCKAKFGSEPKEASPIRRASESSPSSPGSRPMPGAAPPAGFFTGASVGEGVVGPGGRPVDPRLDAELPAYLSRPMQGQALTSTNYATEQSSRSANPFGWLKRRIAIWLSGRQTVSVSVIGYVSAGLIAVLLIVAAIILATLSSAIGVALRTTSLTQAWTELGAGRQSALLVMSVAFGVIGALTLACFSTFVGLSTHNAAGFGIGPLRLTVGQATTCWWKAVWAQLKLAVGFLLPAGLLVAGDSLPGNHLPGLVAALIAVEWAQRSLADPFGFMTKPADHLAELYGKLSVSGTQTSLLGTTWQLCFKAANSLAIVACALPAIGVGVVAAASVAGRTDMLNRSVGGMSPAQLGFLLVGLPLLLTAAASLALLIPVSIDLVGRQGTRRTYARVDRGRSWLDRPGNREEARGADRGRGREPEPETAESGYGEDSQYGGHDRRDLLGGSGGYGNDRGYETRESGGYDDQGFGTGDRDRGAGDQGYGDRGYETRESGGFGGDRGYDDRDRGY